MLTLSSPTVAHDNNLMVDYLFNKYGDLLHNLNQAWLSPQCLQMCADAIHNKGAVLGSCCVSIDDTVKPICHPKDNQRIAKNGNKGENVK